MKNIPKQREEKLSGIVQKPNYDEDFFFIAAVHHLHVDFHVPGIRLYIPRVLQDRCNVSTDSWNRNAAHMWSNEVACWQGKVPEGTEKGRK